MLSYPAYSVRRIREELTPRRARKLLECATKDPPAWAQLAKLNAILCGLLNIKDAVVPEDPKPSDNPERDILEQLASLGPGFKVTAH